MVDREFLRNIENRLYRYFEDIKQIKCLEIECENLENQNKKIKVDIRETNVFIKEESRSISYEERVQFSSDNTSYAERALMNEITNLEKEYVYIQKRLIKNRTKIRDLERRIINIKNYIEILKEEDRKFIELKYRYKKSLEEIGQALNISKTTAFRKREQLIYNISSWNGLDY
jgi:DNA-directed RNA polymerase specialized sigma subunit